MHPSVVGSEHNLNYSKFEEDRIRQQRLGKFKELKLQIQNFQQLLQQGLDVSAPNVRALICRGIPSRFRGAVWPRLLKNKHGVTKEFYSLLLSRSQHIKSRLAEYEDKQSKLSSLKVLKSDINRTFVDLKIFRENNQLAETLEELLAAWLAYRQDIGYVQGMSNLAGFLITELKDYEAFSIFATIITSPTLISHYSFNVEEMGKFQKRFQHIFRVNNEELFFYFQEREVQTQLYLFEWVVTLFTKCLDFEVVGRVWDILMLYEMHWNFIAEVAYAIIHVVRRELYGMEAQSIVRYLKSVRVDAHQQEQFFHLLGRFQR